MATDTPVIIAVSVLLAVVLIAILIFFIIYCSRRVRPGTNVRKRFLPKPDEERAVLRRVVPPSPLPPPRSIEIPRPDYRRELPRALPPPEPRAIMPPEPPRSEHRIITEIHHHDRASTPPPARSRDDWVLVKRKRHRRHRDRRPVDYESSSCSCSSDEEGTRESQNYAPPRMAHPWQSMFYQGMQGGYHPPHPHLDIYDLAMRPPPQQLMLMPPPGAHLPQQPTLLQAPSRPIITSMDDSALPDRGGFLWRSSGITAHPAVATTQLTNYETRERTAIFE